MVHSNKSLSIKGHYLFPIPPEPIHNPWPTLLSMSRQLIQKSPLRCLLISFRFPVPYLLFSLIQKWQYAEQSSIVSQADQNIWMSIKLLQPFDTFICNFWTCESRAFAVARLAIWRGSCLLFCFCRRMTRDKHRTRTGSREIWVKPIGWKQTRWHWVVLRRSETTC
jgi:hypothetical protein